MKVLLIGNGGREHAIAWRLKQSPSVTQIICPNGNPGIARVAETPRVALGTVEKWAAYAVRERIDLVVPGPEAPLADGIADECQERGLLVFGPTQEGARIEASKSFAKEVMFAAEIPTARSETFSDPGKAMDYARTLGLPVVVKADGLAGGKGVAICMNQRELNAALMMNLADGRFGESSRRVVVEEFLEGEEVSIMAITDGEEVYPLSPSQDHKRVFDGDMGPNTGGMGAYAPAPVATDEVMAAALSQVLRPCIDELRNRGVRYRGVLYAGLMVTSQGIKVLEFNCRFGDPETQAVLPLLDGDFGELLLACCENRLSEMIAPASPRQGRPTVALRPEHSVCLVLASGGYPDDYETGKVITGLPETDAPDSVVFHAGTKFGPNGEVLTSGGRVLGLTAWSSSLQTSVNRVYEMAERIKFENCHYRRDIAHRALSRRSNA